MNRHRLNEVNKNIDPCFRINYFDKNITQEDL